MDTFDDTVDPLDLAFANPKAGKKLKPGEVLPGLEGGSRSPALADIPPAPEAALSQALDDAFSNPDFGAGGRSPLEKPVYSETSAAIEEKLARNLDDAFANPKAGNKIEDQAGLESLGLQSTVERPHLETPRLGEPHMDHMPAKSGGMFGPKFLVIAMVLGVVVIAAVMGGSENTSNPKPTIIQLD